MFQTSVLASGSKGNSILIKTLKTKILLDAGLSGKKIFAAIENLSLSGEKLDAVIVSHEHSDHIKGAGIICRKLQIPLYITEPTYNYCVKKIGKLPLGAIFFNPGENFTIKDIEIQPFASSHDAVDSCNFIFKKTGDSERKLAIVTDVGFSSNLLITRLMNSTTIILESNHDFKMLMNGPYPWELKQRIRSREGHLSNEDAVNIIRKVLHPGLKNLVLAHLSDENNDPILAKNLMAKFLQKAGHNLKLLVASQDANTELLEI